ncbi:HAD family hydrolase [Allobaculum mucilyticum]|nr:HAD family hydrolase [Allobaculum mucilyticum]
MNMTTEKQPNNRKPIRAVWVDVDQTLLDFDACAKEALMEAFRQSGLEWDEKYFPIFLSENAKLWDRIENGEMDRDTMVKMRFPFIFKSFHLPLEDPVGFERIFTPRLNTAVHPMPGAIEAMEEIQPMNLPVFIISNGTHDGQTNRIEAAGFTRFIRDLYSSKAIGCAKPDPRFFQEALKRMQKTLGEEIQPEEILVIGDSWKADIQGAIQFGAPSIWFRANRLYDPFEPEDHPSVHPVYSWPEAIEQIRRMIE